MHRSNYRLYSITSSARAWSGSSGNPVRAQTASRAIIRSTSDARRRCSGETGLERPQSSQIRRSLKGHGTPMLGPIACRTLKSGLFSKVDFLTSLPLQPSVAPLRRSVIDFRRNDVVPHVAMHEPHQLS
jgi:hypothetical protein